MTFSPAADRYERMPYRPLRRSGLQASGRVARPVANFGHDRPARNARERSLRRAFDLGVTHFDLANNYGPPYGSAEENFGRHPAARPPPVPRRARRLDQGRATTCGPGRTASGAPASTSSRASTRASPMGLDTSTSSTPTGSIPIRRSRKRWVRSTQRCARGRRSTSESRPTRRSDAEAAAILGELGTPLLIHQPSYSMLNRWIEPGCSTHSASSASAASRSRLSPRACSTDAT